MKRCITHSLTHFLTYSLTHLLTYSLTHLLTYSLTYLLTHTKRILYVASRTERLKRKQELMRRTLILEEEARIDRRAAEKAARRALRIAGTHSLT